MSTVELSTIIEKLKEWEAIQAEAAAEVEALKDQIKAEMNSRGVGNSGCVITFNRVQRIALFNNPWGDTVYIFSKDCDTVHCIQFDKRYR